MTKQNKRREKVQQLYTQLDEGVSRFIDSEAWKQFLAFQSRFHRYSFNNAVLIWAQRPDASLVAGFNQWKKMGRNVKKGERSIQILAPLIRKEEDETGEEVHRVYGYKYVCVFDVSQTEGEQLPSIADPLTTSTDPGRLLYDALRQVITIPVAEENIPGDSCQGYYSPAEHRIALRKGLATDQAAKTLCHEYVHSLLHHKDAEAVPPEARECVAEGTAYVVANYFGLDTSEYSFGYVASWSDGDKDYIRTVGTEIQKTAATIIDRVENALHDEQQAVA